MKLGFVSILYNQFSLGFYFRLDLALSPQIQCTHHSFGSKLSKSLTWDVYVPVRVHYVLEPLWCVAEKEVTFKFPQKGINKNIPWTKPIEGKWGQKGNLLQSCTTIPNQNADFYLNLASQEKNLEKSA